MREAKYPAYNSQITVKNTGKYSKLHCFYLKVTDMVKTGSIFVSITQLVQEFRVYLVSLM